jgi:hypothetical protein
MSKLSDSIKAIMRHDLLVVINIGLDITLVTSAHSLVFTANCGPTSHSMRVMVPLFKHSNYKKNHCVNKEIERGTQVRMEFVPPKCVPVKNLTTTTAAQKQQPPYARTTVSPSQQRAR